jgi:DnaJ-domain-containing protein 1
MNDSSKNYCIQTLRVVPVNHVPLRIMNRMIDLTEDGQAADVIDLATSEDTDDEGESAIHIPPAALNDKATSLIGVEISSDVVDLLADEEDTVADNDGDDDERESLSPAALDDKVTSLIGVEISSDVVDLLVDDEDDEIDSDDKGESPVPAALDDKATSPIGGKISAEVVDLLADGEDDERDTDDESKSLPLATLDDKAKLPIGVEISADVETLPPAALDDKATSPIGRKVSADVVDLLVDDEDDVRDADDESESLPLATLDDKAKLPIGVEISADVVDLLVDDEDEDDKTDDITTYAKSEGFALEKQSVQQSHPRKYIMASRKRKREKALQKEAEERAEALQRKPKAADRFNPENIPGGCNFVVIDGDSSDEDELEFETSTKKQSNNMGMTADKKAAPPTMQPQKGVLKEPSYRYQKKPFIKRFNPQNENMFRRDKDYNFNISQEDAFEMQERMLRESAARVARMHSSEQVKSSPRTQSIVAPIFDIAERHPDHWRWKEPYACLGLPRNASMTLVKSQYRRLAKIYHPDKSKLADAANRFHGIAIAYRKLSQSD